MKWFMRTSPQCWTETRQMVSSRPACKRTNPEVQKLAAFSKFEQKCDQKWQANPSTQDATTETCLEVEGLYIKKLQAENEQLRAQLEKNRFNYDEFKRNGTAFKYYTGLSNQQFEALWSFLDPERSTNSMSIEIARWVLVKGPQFLYWFE